jgi:hypothetical protein
MEELGKLREAHGVLISMIKNHHIQIDDKIPPKPAIQYTPPTEPTQRISNLISCRGHTDDGKNRKKLERNSIVEAEEMYRALQKNAYLQIIKQNGQGDLKVNFLK